MTYCAYFNLRNLRNWGAWQMFRSSGQPDAKPPVFSFQASLPDLSPIEHVWDMMGKRLHLPGIVDDLALQLEQIRQEILQETIRDLCHSVPRCVVAYIDARVVSTAY
ncbi:hypothetical protein TNCV_56521 [Trichonephila clavipes]|nr:hypothetical protein TNCV_56521 [Trichonephila clavipes]